MNLQRKDAYICLENGKVFKGKQFGAFKETIAELVFTTGMCGYIETLTDPSYFGQMVIQTFPLIGNYGMIESDMESRASFISAYIVRESCDEPSNFRNDGTTVEQFLNKNGIPGVCDVDTRELTRTLREFGVMNAIITTDPDSVDFEKVKAYKINKAVETVSVDSPKLQPSENHKFNVVLLDYGAKENIVRELVKRNCNVAIMPHNTKAEDILKLDIDGVMLSNGPGDPEDNEFEIQQIKQLVGKTPIFGICLGHQLLALANGCKTEKLKYGHRGVNQPVKNLETGRTYISSQNHGYAVINDSVEENGGIISFINANDDTCEGINYPDLNAYSVQFHPEACSGPLDTSFLFDKFISIMEGNHNA